MIHDLRFTPGAVARDPWPVTHDAVGRPRATRHESPGTRHEQVTAGAASDPASGITSHTCDRQTRQIARDFESVLLTRLFEQVQASIGT